MSDPRGLAGLNLARACKDAWVNSQGRVLPTDLARQSIGQLLALAGALPGSGRSLSLAEAMERVNERRRRDGLPLVPAIQIRQ